MTALQRLEQWRYESNIDQESMISAAQGGYFTAQAWQVGTHDNGRGAPEIKMMREADGMEAIFDGDTGAPVVGPPFGGTRNLVTPLPMNTDAVAANGGGPIGVFSVVSSWLGHAIADMLPPLITPQGR